MESISELGAMLNEVRTRDAALRVFGAADHRYASRPASAPELEQLEQRIGIALPASYYGVLSVLGSGVGPYYGLWSPQQSWAELQSGAEDCVINERDVPSAARPFSLSVPAPGAGRVEAQFPTDGAIPIVHHGCSMWSLLITAGRWRGTVWDVACHAGVDGEYLPTLRPPAVNLSPSQRRTTLPSFPEPPSFFTWYRGWLEQCLAELSPS
jgi:hypothetical protein